MPIGVLTNCAAVLLGGVLGSALGKVLPEDLKDNLPTLFGLCSIGIGINSVIKVSGMTAVVLALLVGCSEADKVNHNMSKQADYFECERRVTVYNARTDNVILECEGYLSISNNDTNELVVTVKTGPDSYKKNYIYLNAYTLYVVEDITGTHTDPYHYQMYFHTELLPNVDVKP